MIVSAVIPVQGPPAAPPIPLRVLTCAYWREKRLRRHLRIQAFLAAPETLDALLPGLGTLPPGPGNDRLRDYRYGDDGQFGLTKLDADPDELWAALVAQRIRCWRALRPTEQFAAQVCRYGQGAACCRFLGRDSTGWLCAKRTPLAGYLNDRVAAGQMDERGDNCSGRGAR